MNDEISKRAKITSCPDYSSIKARLDRDGEVFLTVKEISENAYAIVFIEDGARAAAMIAADLLRQAAAMIETVRDLIGGVK